MKRAFLCGLGFALLLIGVVSGVRPLGEEGPRWFSILASLVALLFSVLVVLEARRAPAHKSWLVSIVAWVCGYLAISVIGGVLLIVISLIVGAPIPIISNGTIIFQRF
jgi:hypothetical protein